MRFVGYLGIPGSEESTGTAPIGKVNSPCTDTMAMVNERQIKEYIFFRQCIILNIHNNYQKILFDKLNFPSLIKELNRHGVLSFAIFFRSKIVRMNRISKYIKMQ